MLEPFEDDYKDDMKTILSEDSRVIVLATQLVQLLLSLCMAVFQLVFHLVIHIVLHLFFQNIHVLPIF